MFSISLWLNQNGLGKYVEQFESNDIDLEILPELTKEDLKELGLSLGHQKKFFKSVRELPPDVPDNTSTYSYQNSQTSSSEYRQLTVMFCDLADSTMLVNRIGAELMRDINRDYQDVCAQAVSRYNGFIASYLGDGIVVYFGYPQAHEQDAERSIKAGLLVLELMRALNEKYQQTLGIELGVRIGIATGPVVVGDIIGEGSAMQTAVVGGTPNLAARIQGVAPRDAVVVSDRTHRLAKLAFEYEDIGLHEAKGFDEPIQVWHVSKERSLKRRVEASLHTLNTATIGRQEELSMLGSRWDSVCSGQGQLITLSGEAGIGKSHLVEKFLKTVLDDDHECLRLQCSPYHRGSVLFPFLENMELYFASEINGADRSVDAVNQYFQRSSRYRTEAVSYFCQLLSIPIPPGTLQTDLEPLALKQRGFDGWVDVLARDAAVSPMIMIVEDAHWLDATSIELLDVLIRRLHEFPLLLIISSRPEFTPAWGRHRCVETAIGLQRLGHQHTQHIIKLLTGELTMPDQLVSLILDKTDGVPLFVEEFTKSILATTEIGNIRSANDIDAAIKAIDVPETLNDLLMSRLDTEPMIKSVAQIGATIGRDFDYDLLSSVAPHTESELQQSLSAVVGADIAFETASHPSLIYTFRHALLQDAAYHSLLTKSRQRLHGNIATAMEASAAGSFSSEIIAHHWTESGQLAKAVVHWQVAARDAASVWANRDAVKRYKNAVACFKQMESSSPESIVLELDLLLELGDALRAAQGSSSDEAINVFNKATERCMHATDFDYTVRSFYGSFATNFTAARLPAAAFAAEALLESATAQNHSAGLAAAHQALGMYAFATNQLVEARRHLDRALTFRNSFKFTHDFQFPVLSQSYLAWTLYLTGQKVAAHDLIDDAVDEARSVSAYSQALIMANACYLHQFESDVDRLATLTQELKVFSLEKGFPVWHAVAEFFDCWQQCRRVANVQNNEKLLKTLEFWSEDEIETPYFKSIVAETLFQAGQTRRGYELAMNARALMDKTGEIWFRENLNIILARYADAR